MISPIGIVRNFSGVLVISQCLTGTIDESESARVVMPRLASFLIISYVSPAPVV